MNGCKYSVFDNDIARYQCTITGDECVYFLPSYQRCVKEFLDDEERIGDETS